MHDTHYECMRNIYEDEHSITIFIYMIVQSHAMTYKIFEFTFGAFFFSLLLLYHYILCAFFGAKAMKACNTCVFVCVCVCYAHVELLLLFPHFNPQSVFIFNKLFMWILVFMRFENSLSLRLV